MDVVARKQAKLLSDEIAVLKDMVVVLQRGLCDSSTTLRTDFSDTVSRFASALATSLAEVARHLDAKIALIHERLDLT